MSKNVVATDTAPPPAGTYSQAVLADGPFLFISGQTPRTADGTRLTGASLEAKARQALDNLAAVANAAGLSLNDAVKVTVYLKDLAAKPEFENVYRDYFADPAPARSIVQSSFIDFDLEIDAILQARRGDREA
jgi:reactive intermediate/imine deaminase